MTDTKARRGVFISYARKDGEEFAARLKTRIDDAGISSVWRDREQMYGGHNWWLQISGSLESVEFLVLVITPAAIESRTVQQEWRQALREGVCVFGVKSPPDVDLQKLPRWITSKHIYDVGTLMPDAPAPELTKFLNDLNTTCRQPRVPFMTSELPVEFVQRPRELQLLKQQLLDVKEEKVLSITAALRGAGGFGKTTLARALCHDDDVQTFFHDGILWTTLGETPGDLTPRVDELIQALTGQKGGFATLDGATARLRELLADRSLLIVIDDAWNAAHLTPFTEGGPNCARLVTTRMVEVVPPKSIKVKVDAMEPAEAEQLLRFDLPPGSDQAFAELVPLLGEWPLLLKLVNGVLRYRVQETGQPLEDALEFVRSDLAENGLVAFDAAEPQARHQAVSATLGASVALLNTDDRVRLSQLAIFPEDVEIPLRTIGKLWELNLTSTEKLCDRLFRLSLVLDLNLKNRVLRLHDVVRKYLIHQQGDQISTVHRRLLTLARPQGHNHQALVSDWTKLSDDEPYFWDYLAYHFVESKQVSQLDELLAAETANGQNAWYQAKTRARGDAGYLADLKMAWDTASAESQLQVESGHAVSSLTREIRYALITSSLRSLDAKVPVDLLLAFAEKGVIPVAQVIAHAESLPHGTAAQGFQKNKTLVLLAEKLDEPLRTHLFQTALVVVKETILADDRARLAATLAWHSSESLLKELSKIADGENRKEAEVILSAIAVRYAKLGKIDLALEIGAGITDEPTLAETLVAIAPRMELKHIDPAMNLTKKLVDHRQGYPYAHLAARLAALGKIDDALRITTSILTTHSQADALIRMANDITADHLDAAISLANTIGDFAARINALGHLGRQLPEPQRSKFLFDLMEEVDQSPDRAADYAHELLIPQLPLDVLRQEKLGKGSLYVYSYEKRKLFNLMLAQLAKQDCLEEAFTLLRKTISTGERAEGLESVVPYLTENYIGQAREILAESPRPRQEWTLRKLLPRIAELGQAVEALDEALRIETETCRTDAIAGIAPYLDAPSLRRLRDVAQNIQDNGEQNTALVQFAAFSKNPVGMFRDCAANVTERELMSALLRLQRNSPDQQVIHEIFNDLKSFQLSETTYALVRVMLSRWLSASEQRAAFNDLFLVEWQLDGSYMLLEQLSLLVPIHDDAQLDTEVRGAALNLGWGLVSSDDKISPNLFVDVIPQLARLGDVDRILGTVDQLEEHHRIVVLAHLLPFAEPEIRSEIEHNLLQTVTDYENPYDAVIGLGKCADSLTLQLVERVLQIANDKCDAESIPRELSKLAVRLAELGKPEESLRIAQLISPNREIDLTSALTGIGRHLRGVVRDQTLTEALRLTCRITNPIGSGIWKYDRAARLGPLAEELANMSPEVLYPEWRKAFRVLGNYAREEFLVDLGALAPVIFQLGGAAVIDELPEAIDNVRRWWP